MRTAKEPPKCGATGVTGPNSYLPKLLQDTVGAKFNIVTGYPGGTDIDLAVERGEIHCRAFTIEAFFGREPYHTWRKTGFVRHMFQTGSKSDARLPHTPTIFEIMDRYKTPESGRRLATVLLGADDMGGRCSVRPHAGRSLEDSRATRLSKPCTTSSSAPK